MTWRTRLGGDWLPGARPSRAGAMRRVERPYQRGYAEVCDLRSGARAQRRRGSWFFDILRRFGEAELELLRATLDRAVPAGEIYSARQWTRQVADE